MDKIILRGLPVDCVIGTLPSERVSPQRLYFDLTLSGDFSRAGSTASAPPAITTASAGKRSNIRRAAAARPAA